jgi:hypothetical protein
MPSVPGARAIVCGAREFADRDFVFAALDLIHEEMPIGILVQSGGPGVDQFAMEWAQDRRVQSEEYASSSAPMTLEEAAEGSRYDEMVAAGADFCLAFPGDHHSAGLLRRAAEAGIPILKP